MRAQLVGAERAVEPDGDGPQCCTAYQNASTVWPERLRPERSVMVIDSMIGTSHAHLRRSLLKRAKPAGLGVERVEDRLDQNEVRAAFDEGAGLLAIDIDQRIEVDLAEAGIVDVRRERRGAVGRPDGAGDEARLSGVRPIFIGQPAGELGRGNVDLADQMLPAP